MSAGDAGDYSEFLSSTQSVLYAGQRLREALYEDPQTLEYTINGLEQAVDRHRAGSSQFQTFMFSAMESAEQPEQRERIAGDTVASVLADLQVANVLLSAGQTLGETGQASGPAALDDALSALEGTSLGLERASFSSMEAGAQYGRFGFAAAPAEAASEPSLDLTTACNSFSTASKDTLSLLVSESREVVTGLAKAVSEIDQEKLLKSLGIFSKQVEQLPKVGRLFRQGLTKLENAINALIKLLGSGTLDKIKDQVAKLWGDIKQGKYIDDAFRYLYQVKQTQEMVDKSLGGKNLQIKALDDRRQELVKLGVAYKESMSFASGIVAALSLAGSLLTLAAATSPALAGSPAALILAGAFSLVLAYVVLNGLDYADATPLLKRVRGVRQICGGLAPQPKEAEYGEPGSAAGQD
jgi:hypothetical protein